MIKATDKFWLVNATAFMVNGEYVISYSLVATANTKDSIIEQLQFYYNETVKAVAKYYHPNFDVSIYPCAPYYVICKARDVEISNKHILNTL